MKIEDMDLKTKVAQLFTFSGFHSELDEDTRKLITELKAGGIFIPSGSLKHPEQVYQLTDDMQTVSLKEGSGIPLFIAADFIAGAGCKLQYGAVHFPKNRAIGASGDESLAYESGRITAEESLAMGVNFNYSPVVDINNNPLNPVIGTHSFGADMDTVSRLGNAVIRGYQESGLIATAKHFPGHGDTHVDSHEDLPVLNFDRERLESFELVPFQRAIDEGVDAIMVGHIAVPALDPSLTPASLSYPLVTELLREKMNFKGLIVTDGLSMKGITNKYSMEEACVRSILAGTDILLATTNTYEQAASLLNAVMDAVKDGTIAESRIDESVERILFAKIKYRLTAEAYNYTAFKAESFNKLGAQHVNASLAWKAVTPLHGLEQGALVDKLEESWMLLRDQPTSLFRGASASAAFLGAASGR
ncbi:glycoside hydrolase family 3 protein [Paenibacillus abyssi]|uniref:glycoside hydrolase family 3 protein n=1 Tax=Paenibacillus abyssi TaxID=1340531 RepID=UPI00361EAC6B